ncbi:hypothetical protein WA158_008397 [Blastocystis sp. Blastoise]
MEKVYYDGQEIHDAGRIKAHTRSIRCIIANDDSIISASDDGSIKIWDPVNGQLKRELTGHKDRVRALTFWKGYLVSGGVDKTIKLWDLKTGDCVQTIESNEGSIFTLNVYRNMLCSGGSGNVIQIWNKKYQMAGKISGHSDWINDILVWDDDRIITCSDDKTIKVWDLKKSKCIGTLIGHTSFVKKLVKYHNRLLSCSFDTTILVWDVDSLAQVNILRGHSDFIYTMSVYGDRVVSADASGTIFFWSKDLTHKEIVLQVHTMDVFTTCMYKDRLITGSRDRSIVIWPTYTELEDLIASLSKPTGLDSVEIQKEYIATLEKSLGLLKAELNDVNQKYQEIQKDRVLLKDLNSKKDSTILALANQIDGMKQQLSIAYDPENNQGNDAKNNMYNCVLKESFPSMPHTTTPLPGSLFFSSYYNSICIDLLPSLSSSIHPIYTKKQLYDYCLYLSPWKSMDFPNINKFYGIYLQENKPVHIYTEYMPYTLTNLIDCITDSGKINKIIVEKESLECDEEFTETKVVDSHGGMEQLPFCKKVDIILDIVKALLYMSTINPPIHHGYLNPSTILLSSNLNAQITFPNCVYLCSSMFSIPIHPLFTPPEIFSKYNSSQQTLPAYELYSMIDEACDVYQIGLLIYYLFMGTTYTSTMSSSSVPYREIAAILGFCLQSNPKSRPSLATLYTSLSSLTRLDLYTASLSHVTFLYTDTKNENHIYISP